MLALKFTIYQVRMYHIAFAVGAGATAVLPPTPAKL